MSARDNGGFTVRSGMWMRKRRMATRAPIGRFMKKPNSKQSVLWLVEEQVCIKEKKLTPSPGRVFG